MTRCLFFCALLTLSLAGCTSEMEEATEPPKTNTAQPNELALKQVLIRGSLPINVGFHDVNNDSRLDMFIGTFGHEFFTDDEAPIQHAGESYRRKIATHPEPIVTHQLSIHLNETKPSDSRSGSTGEQKLTFGSANWLTEWTQGESFLPPG